MLALPLGDNRAFENEPVEDIIQPLCISVAVGGILRQGLAMMGRNEDLPPHLSNAHLLNLEETKP